MANWQCTFYDTLADAETAIESIGAEKHLHLFIFGEEAHQKVGVINRS